jgi:hypothetical protein
LPLGNKQLIIPFAIVVGIFLMYDIAKGELIEEPQEENNFTQVYDVMNTYMVENSSTKLSTDSKIPKAVFSIITRVIGPLIYYTFPKFTFKSLFVYNNPQLREFIKQLSQGHRNIRLKQIDGCSLEDFFVKEDCSDETDDLEDKLPNDLFPYLFKSDYKFSDKDKKRWIALQVLRKQSKDKEPVGQMFIHMFKTLEPRVEIPYRIKPRMKERIVLMFMIMGERSTIQYITTKINTMAVQYQQKRS